MRVEREGVSRNLPRGKVSLNQAVDFLTKHSASKGEFGSEQISQELRLNKNTVDNTLKYFTIFSMIVPETRESESDIPDPLQAGKSYKQGEVFQVEPLHNYRRDSPEFNVDQFEYLSRLFTGPDWQISPSQDVGKQLETEYIAKIASTTEKHKKRVEDEMRRKKIQAGEE